jgi:GntR family transcriptional regulator
MAGTTVNIESMARFSPLYQQIEQLLVRAMESGEWLPGQVIPSESELATRFGVSPGTIRKAIDNMVTANLLVRKQGRGTFVVSLQDSAINTRFFRLQPREGQFVAPLIEPLECWHAKAGQEASRVLKRSAGAPITILRTLSRLHDKPLLLDEIYLPGDLFPGLSLERLQAVSGTLYAWFEKEFSVQVLRAQEYVRAVSADKRTAELLQVEAAQPLLAIERVAYSYRDEAVEWRRSWCLSQDYCYGSTLV